MMLIKKIEYEKIMIMKIFMILYLIIIIIF